LYFNVSQSRASNVEGENVKKIGLWIASAVMMTTVHAQQSSAGSVHHHANNVAQRNGNQMAPSSNAAALHYGWQSVDGIKLFYREGGSVESPTLVLLHGSPTSSIMYQSMMERLAGTGQLHVVAVDYPSYGYSDAPDHQQYKDTFDNIAVTVAHFLKARNIRRYALFMQDYGVPIGFRLIQAEPTNVSALIVQNGVIHLDGFPMAQDPDGELPRYWRNLNPAVDKRFADDVAHLSFPSADNWTLGENMSPDEQLLMMVSEQRPGVVEARSDLWRDYGSNMPHYPEWQKLLKSLDVPVEVIWGSHDKFFTVPGAIAYLRDKPQAEIHILDAGHFATIEVPNLVADLVADFTRRNNLR
jgi:pimeloyl-ACP methyl ester carboxylesterase